MASPGSSVGDSGQISEHGIVEPQPRSALVTATDVREPYPCQQVPLLDELLAVFDGQLTHTRAQHEGFGDRLTTTRKGFCHHLT